MNWKREAYGKSRKLIRREVEEYDKSGTDEIVLINEAKFVGR